MFIRRLLDIVAIIKFLLSGQAKHAGAVLKAHREYRRQLPLLKKQRRKIPEGNTPYYGDTIMKNSLLWQYYARGRKTFSRLRYQPPVYTEDTASTNGSWRLR